MKKCSKSPCVTCTRVADPNKCENKECQQWRSWFLRRWADIRAYAKAQGLVPEETPLGPDPCERCRFPVALCTTPCPDKRFWEKRKGETQ